MAQPAIYKETRMNSIIIDLLDEDRIVVPSDIDHTKTLVLGKFDEMWFPKDMFSALYQTEWLLKRIADNNLEIISALTIYVPISPLAIGMSVAIGQRLNVTPHIMIVPRMGEPWDMYPFFETGADIFATFVEKVETV